MALRLRDMIRPTKLVIKEFVLDETIGENEETIPVIRLTLVNKVEARSSRLIDGRSLPAYDDQVMIVGNEDIQLFEEQANEEADGTISYEGEMKLDVSAPRIIRGEKIPARIFLTADSFNNRSKRMRQQNREAAKAHLEEYLGGVETQLTTVRSTAQPVEAGG